jgi:hypothetical protein
MRLLGLPKRRNDKGIEQMNRRRFLEFAARSVAGVLAGGAVDTMTTAHAAAHKGVSRPGFIEVTDGARLTFTGRGQGRPVLFADVCAPTVLRWRARTDWR